MLLILKVQQSRVKPHNLRLAPKCEYFLFKRVCYVLGWFFIFELPLPLAMVCMWVCVCACVYAAVFLSGLLPLVFGIRQYLYLL